MVGSKRYCRICVWITCGRRGATSTYGRGVGWLVAMASRGVLGNGTSARSR